MTGKDDWKPIRFGQNKVPTAMGFFGQPLAGSASTIAGTGQTFGGAGIIGFEPASDKQSIMIYKKKSHYNEWEFVYDPLSEMKTIPGNSGGIGQPATSTTTPIGGSGSGGPGFGGSGGGGSTPVTTPPQQ